ncbi:ATP-dependent DNA helicase [Trichonephila clavipes]|nr:ATP-dependent DNA helicase [Trichonephila clavipes]
MVHLIISIHERHPTVIHLAVHLENGQRVYFTADNVRARALVPPATTLTAFYSLRQDDLLLKLCFILKYRNSTRGMHRLKSFNVANKVKAVEGHTKFIFQLCIGSSVHCSSEQYRMILSKIALLINVRGPISFQDLRTVNGQLCATYRQACQELNLLENDEHWDTALADASNTARPQQIRTLFAIILTTCFPSNPKKIFGKIQGLHE